MVWGVGGWHLIALYAGALEENAVEWYAVFLISLVVEVGIGEQWLALLFLGLSLTCSVDKGIRVDEGGHSIEEHSHALVCAREHGLDVNHVGVVAAKWSINKAFQGELPMHP